MVKNKLFAGLSVLALSGLAACGGEEVENADVVTEEVVTQPQMETVEVPVMTQDTAVVQTEISVDTAVDVDTIENPNLR